MSQTAGGDSQILYLDLMGPISKGRGREEKGKEGTGREKGLGDEEGRRREGEESETPSDLL